MKHQELDRGLGHKPFYRQIKEFLKTKITEGDFKFGDLIPTEIELKNIFKVSRITSRQAIVDLEKEGYLSRVRGQGTKVIYKGMIEEELSKIMSFTNEMKKRGIVPGTKYAHISIVKADEKLAEEYSCNEGDDLYRIERVRTGDGVPIVYFVTYILGKYDLPLNDIDYYSSLYEFFEKRGIPSVYYSTDKLSACIADKNLAKKLEIEVNEPLLLRIRKSFSEKREVVEYTISYYPASRYSYRIVDLVKNK